MRVSNSSAATAMPHATACPTLSLESGKGVGKGEKASGTDNGFLLPMCPKSVPEAYLPRSLGDVSMRQDVTHRQQLVDDRIDALRHGELAGIETDLGVQGGLVGIVDTGEAHGFPCGQSCPGLRVHSLDVALFADFDRG